MSALYIHIPFCKQACHYCDFHFSTKTENRLPMVQAIIKEIELQQHYLKSTNLTSIYFGGGTPSLLSERELQLIFESISKYFSWNLDTEITLEANPDDMTLEKIQIFKKNHINRLSIGIQSFDEAHLKYLNRSHSALEAEKCVRNAQNAGIENISVDLIYAIPAIDHEIWRNDLEKVCELGVSHISAYCLTIEPQTAFDSWLKKGKIKPIDDDFAAEQFEILLEQTQKSGFLQYEICSFCKDDKYSRHNSNYWKKGDYLGVGASAHSYNGTTRQYNISNNQKYIQKILENEIPCEIETLTWKNQVNEYIFTSLRTIWGCNLEFLQQFSEINFENEHQSIIKNYEKHGFLYQDAHILHLTQKGKLIADKISEDLFLI
jgi:oxygen-independent coproporphyrinogen III oxidase